MPNAILTKDDGNRFSIPASQVVAISSIEKALTKPPKNPNAKAVVFSLVRGFSIHFVGMTGREVFEEVARQDSAEREWLEMPVGNDAHYLPRDAHLNMVEEMDFKGEKAIRVHFNKPDGHSAFLDAEHTEELFARLTALVGGADPGDDVASAPVRALPRPRPRR